ncbi:MAG: hypothetical protein JSR18_11470 [Proteobacteria bacterium]|nr:hypothetical protein [Pseudomonadota bacterium]
MTASASASSAVHALPARWRWVPLVATCVACVALVWGLAYWAWYWLAPWPVHRNASVPADPAATIVASGLMQDGAAPSAGAAAAPATLGGDVRLLGTFAEKDGNGYALFRLPSGPRLVAVGGDIANGATLAAVTSDGIRVRDGAGERAIALRGKSAAATRVADAGAPRASAASGRDPSCKPPPGFKGAVVKLNAELLQGIVAQPDTLRAIVQPVEGGGVTVRDGSGFGEMLGITSADRVRTANGVPLSGPSDVIAAIVRPLVASQPVRIAGIHEGQAQEMLLLNAGTCP